jgi:hypothetical protein
MIQLEGRSSIIFPLSLVFNMKRVRLIKICTNENYSTNRVEKYLSDVMFRIKNDLTQ